MTPEIDDDGNNRPEIENQAAIEHTRQAISRYATAWLAGDRASLAACYHDDFTLHYFGRNPLAGDHTGKAAALGILAEVTRRTNRRLLAIVDFSLRLHTCFVPGHFAFGLMSQQPAVPVLAQAQQFATFS